MQENKARTEGEKLIFKTKACQGFQNFSLAKLLFLIIRKYKERKKIQDENEAEEILDSSRMSRFYLKEKKGVTN